MAHIQIICTNCGEILENPKIEGYGRYDTDGVEITYNCQCGNEYLIVVDTITEEIDFYEE